MENQEIKITLKEYKELRKMCEELKQLEGDYKYLYHLYKEQQKIIGEYESYLYGDEEELEVKNPIGFNR